MGAYDAYAKLSVAGSAFQLEEYELVCEPQVDSRGGGRVGSLFTLKAIGFIEAATVADLSTAVQAAARLANTTVREDVVLTGVGGVEEFRFVASTATQGYPAVRVTVATAGGDGGELRRGCTLEVRALYGAADDWEVEEVKRYRVRTVVGADGRETVTRTGTASTRRAGPAGQPGMTGERVLQQIILPAWRKQYPLRYASGVPGWVTGYDSETDADGRSVSYTLTAERLTDVLPQAEDGKAVDGTVSTTDDLDGSGRRVTTVTVDLVVEGNPYDVIAAVRPKPSTDDRKPSALVGESVTVSWTKGVRVRASFRLLSGASGGRVLGFEQSVSTQGETVGVAFKTFPGLPPLAYYPVAGPTTAVQRGRATGLGRRVLPPPFLWPSSYLAGPEQVEVTRRSESEWETTWTYTFAFPGGAPAVTAEQWTSLATPPAVAPVPGTDPETEGDNA